MDVQQHDFDAFTAMRVKLIREREIIRLTEAILEVFLVNQGRRTTLYQASEAIKAEIEKAFP
jgi:hypothetical protein